MNGFGDFRDVELDCADELGLDETERHPAMTAETVSPELIDQAGRHLRFLEAKRNRVNQLAANALAFEQDRIEAWRQSKLGTVPEQIENTAVALRSMAAVYLDGRKTRSVSTPNVTVSTRTTTKWLWPSDDALLTWARECAPSLVRSKTTTVESFDKNAAKATAVVTEGHAHLFGEQVCEVATVVDFTIDTNPVVEPAR